MRRYMENLITNLLAKCPARNAGLEPSSSLMVRCE